LLNQKKGDEFIESVEEASPCEQNGDVGEKVARLLDVKVRALYVILGVVAGDCQ